MMTAAGIHARLALLLCFISSAACNMFAFTEEPFERAGKADGYCSRILRAQSNRKEGSTEFRLRVEGDPESYQPGSTYRVTLIASSPSYFRGFTLIALKEGTEGDKDEDYAGNFQIIDEEETQFMTNCPPAVTESTPRRRTSIQVFWTAPPSGSGCILLKASIVQKRIIYFQDEGSLTKRMCERESLYGEATDKPLLDCCACGTAKYRVTFYGNWSEKIHPKDYPRRANHWSAIIGASHSKNYVLWEYGGLASEGVKQVAELGSPVKMEEEIRQKGNQAISNAYKSQSSQEHSRPWWSQCRGRGSGGGRGASDSHCDPALDETMCLLEMSQHMLRLQSPDPFERRMWEFAFRRHQSKPWVLATQHHSVDGEKSRETARLAETSHERVIPSSSVPSATMYL